MQRFSDCMSRGSVFSGGLEILNSNCVILCVEYENQDGWAGGAQAEITGVCVKIVFDQYI